MSMKSLGLTLTLAIALVTLGYASPSFAAPKNCVKDDPRPSCPDGNDPPVPEPDPSATFKVEVYFNDYKPATADGTVNPAEGKIAGQRRSVSAPVMTLVLDDLNVGLEALNLVDCAINTFGMPDDGQFGLSTYKNKQSGEYTFAAANYRDFSVGGTNRYRIAFRFDDPLDIEIDIDWLPNSTEVATFAGHQVTLSGQQGGNDDECEGDIDIDWWIDVTGN